MTMKPQLARSFKRGKDEGLWVSSRHVVEEKLDGYRLIGGDGTFLTRAGNELDPALGDAEILIGKARVDGELIIDPIQEIPQGHSEVTHWLVEDPTVLKLVLFDCLRDETGRDLMNEPWEDRVACLHHLFESLPLGDHLRISLAQ
jgi:ATP-dependent DNA ligase